jgi:acyl dehydratase
VRQVEGQKEKQTEPKSLGVAVGQRTVTEASVHAFGCLTGDYARMHLDHEFGRSTPQGGPIAHGLLNACWAVGALTQYAPELLFVEDPEAWLAGFSVRLSRMVAVGDTLGVRWSATKGHALELSEEDAVYASSTAFEVPNQRDELTSSGVVTVCRAGSRGGLAALPDAPEPWPVEDWCLPRSPSLFYAEDLLESGPRGETFGQTVTETDVVAFAREVGELNPRYLNAEFARRSLFGERIAPPMLIFCLGFAEWLQVLLRTPMPSSGFAGHLGDSWRFFRPVRIGDTIRTRHRPLSCERSKGRPDQAILQFGIQVVNQHEEVVQDGRVVMMISGRPG